MYNVIQFLFGVTFLYYGAEFLVKGSISVARRFNISPLIVGITLVALGTSLPEVFVSILANLKDQQGMVIGNVIGSNIANIGLVLGITAIISSVNFPFSKVRYDMYFLLAISFLLLFFIMIGGLVFWQGMVFILIMIIYFTFLIINNRLTDSEQNVHEDNNRFFLVIQLIIGTIGLGFGALFFIEGAKGIAIYLGVSDLVIGMSIVALGTSLPELAASLSSIKHGESGLIIGNVIGSNIMNIILVLGITLFFGNIHIVFSEIIIYGFFMLLFTISLLILLKMKNKINKFSGFVFIMIYILFLYLNFSNI